MYLTRRNEHKIDAKRGKRLTRKKPTVAFNFEQLGVNFTDN